MRDNWYADDRDLVKWAAAITLARRWNQPLIVQVPFLRLGERHPIYIDEEEVPLPQEAWEHFRDIGQIKRLSKSTKIKIRSIQTEVGSTKAERAAYLDAVINQMTKQAEPKLVLLDPDTGIEPKKAGAKHVTLNDIQQVWNALRQSDGLAVYQHAWRDRNWRNVAKERLTQAVQSDQVILCQSRRFASDVAILAVKRSNAS